MNDNPQANAAAFNAATREQELEARCARLEALCEEVYGVVVDANLMGRGGPEVRAALIRVDRRLRESGLLKRFPPTKSVPAKGDVYMDAAVAKDIAGERVDQEGGRLEP